MVHVPLCFMFLMSACAWILSVRGVFAQKKFCISVFSLMLLFIRCVCMCELCRICFLHFPVLPLLLFSVMSPTVSLPTRPASLDLSHEEATFWLQWCVLKNPYLNSADPPPWEESSFWIRGCRLVEQHIFKYLKKGATSVMEHNCLQYQLNDQILLQRVCSSQTLLNGNQSNSSHQKASTAKMSTTNKQIVHKNVLLRLQSSWISSTEDG